MDIDGPEITALRAKVRAADEEFQLALACHEAWKPAAYDSTLHERLGTSYASNTFQVVRLALRREVVLALMRLWDNRKDAVGMFSIANTLGNERAIDALSAECAAHWQNRLLSGFKDEPNEVVDAIRRSEDKFGQSQAESLRQHAADAIRIIKGYEEGGPGYSTLTKLKTIRNERLAHRQVRPTPSAPDATDTLDEEIQAFYEDMLRLVRHLLLAVHGTDYNPEASANIAAKNAALFWASVRGERTAGHPNYQTKPVRPDR